MKMILECPEDRLEMEIIAFGMLELSSTIFCVKDGFFLFFACRHQPGFHTIWGPANMQGSRSEDVDETSCGDRGSPPAEDAQERLTASRAPQKTLPGQ